MAPNKQNIDEVQKLNLKECFIEWIRKRDVYL